MLETKSRHYDLLCCPCVDGCPHASCVTFGTQETELRRLLPPETVCAYESMLATEARLSALGIPHVGLLSVVPLDRLQIAIDQLPLHDPQVGLGHRVQGWGPGSGLDTGPGCRWLLTSCRCTTQSWAKAQGTGYRVQGHGSRAWGVPAFRVHGSSVKDTAAIALQALLHWAAVPGSW